MVGLIQWRPHLDPIKSKSENHFDWANGCFNLPQVRTQSKPNPNPIEAQIQFNFPANRIKNPTETESSPELFQAKPTRIWSLSHHISCDIVRPDDNPIEIPVEIILIPDETNQSRMVY